MTAVVAAAVILIELTLLIHALRSPKWRRILGWAFVTLVTAAGVMYVSCVLVIVLAASQNA